LSIDLIYARHRKQTPELWRKELTQALGLGLSHISLYTLTIEPGTAFYRKLHTKQEKDKIYIPDSDQAADLFRVTQEVTSKAGLMQYEISNFAIPGQESIHNINYWNSGDFIGIGPGAAGRLTLGNSRYAIIQIKHPKTWMDTVEQKGIGTEEINLLTPAERIQEVLLSGLRTKWGITRNIFKYHSNGNDIEQVLNMQQINKLEQAGLIELDNIALRATPKGFLLLDTILSELAVIPTEFLTKSG